MTYPKQDVHMKSLDGDLQQEVNMSHRIENCFQS